MSYTFRSVGTLTQGSTNSSTPGQAAGIVAGDLLLIHCCERSNANTITVPTGWTMLHPHVNDTYNGLLARIASGTSADNAPAVIWSGTAQCSTQMAAFFGTVYTDLTTIVHASVDESGNGAGSGGNDISYSALTISLANCLVIARGMHNKTATGNYSPTNGGVNSLAGFTQIDQLTPNGTVFSEWWGYQQQTTATNLNAVIQTRNTVVESLQQSSLFIALKSAAAANSANKAFIKNQQCINNG